MLLIFYFYLFYFRIWCTFVLHYSSQQKENKQALDIEIFFIAGIPLRYFQTSFTVTFAVLFLAIKSSVYSSSDPLIYKNTFWGLLTSTVVICIFIFNYIYIQVCFIYFKYCWQLYERPSIVVHINYEDFSHILGLFLHIAI